MPRIAILTEGSSEPFAAKTATGILRYRPNDVVAVIDAEHVGKTAGEVLGTGGDVPFVASLEETDADTLLIGIAPAGGRLPEAWRQIVRTALERGMEVISGLHQFLADDEEFSRLATAHGGRIRDVRRPPPGIGVSRDRARRSATHRVHTVGHDCGVGKMVVALEITRALEERGHDAKFIATGQTGILIAGEGVPVDHVVSDFVAGAVDELVARDAAKEFLVVEGQGSLSHPLYSGVTLGLLHGCAPQTMIMTFDPTRDTLRSCGVKAPPLGELIRLYEELASLLTPAKVVAVAANTAALNAEKAARVIDTTEAGLGLPAADVVRDGPEKLVDAILERHASLADGEEASTAL